MDRAADLVVDPAAGLVADLGVDLAAAAEEVRATVFYAVFNLMPFLQF